MATAARLFREHGYNGVSAADIMKQAGFTRGFYNHFASKEELISAASARAFEELKERT